MNAMIPSIILTLDILGFKDKVCELKHINQQERLLHKIIVAAQEVKALYGQLSPQGPNDDGEYKIKFYTDNFIAAIPYNPDNPTEMKARLDDVILYAAIHQWRFAKDDLFIRGSITAGLNYMSEDIVFGKAMIHGHELEANSAKFSRIILDNNLLSLVDYRDKYICIDEDDGMCFINYLKMVGGNESWKSIFRYLNNHHKTICRNLDKYSANPHIREKYQWLARYHDYFCRNNCPSAPELQISPILAEQFSSMNWDRLQKLLKNSQKIK